IDFTHQRLEGEGLANSTFTFEESERHVTALHERREQGAKSRHILFLIDDLIAPRFANFDGLKFSLESGFKNLVFGERILVRLVHVRDHMTEFSSPVRRGGKSPV